MKDADGTVREHWPIFLGGRYLVSFEGLPSGAFEVLGLNDVGGSVMLRSIEDGYSFPVGAATITALTFLGFPGKK